MPIINPMDQDALIRPGARTLTLREILMNIARFIEHVPGLDFVILVKRKDHPIDANHIAVCRGALMENSQIREMLRASLAAYDKGQVNRVTPA